MPEFPPGTEKPGQHHVGGIPVAPFQVISGKSVVRLQVSMVGLTAARRLIHFRAAQGLWRPSLHTVL